MSHPEFILDTREVVLLGLQICQGEVERLACVIFARHGSLDMKHSSIFAADEYTLWGLLTNSTYIRYHNDEGDCTIAIICTIEQILFHRQKIYRSNMLCVPVIVFKHEVVYVPVIVLKHEVVYVAVQFHPWYSFHFPLFLCLVMYDSKYKTKENQNNIMNQG